MAFYHNSKVFTINSLPNSLMRLKHQKCENFFISQNCRLSGRSYIQTQALPHITFFSFMHAAENFKLFMER